MRKHYLNTIIGYLITAFCLCFLPGVSYAGDGNITAESVWSEFDGENNEIYYSRLKDNIWTQKVQLSNKGFRNISPSVSSGTDEITWVVWTAISGSKSHLLFSNCDGETWSSPTQIQTNLSSNTASSIVVDNENIPWIIWAGFDGQDDDIFFTRWNGFNWDASQRVNKDDSMPDILPVGRIDEEGNLSVEWSGYDGKKYRNYSSRYTGSEWDDEIETEIITESMDDDDLDLKYLRMQDSDTKYLLGFGDSITRGVMRSDGSTAEGYEPELEAFIDANLWPSQVLNAGKSGERTSKGVNRIEQKLSIYCLHYVLLLEGANDILNGVSYETTLYNLGIMIDKCIDHNVTPIVATLCPMKLKVSGGRAGYIDEIPNFYNPGIREIAFERGIEVSDHYAALISKWNKYSNDGIHPNETGYSVMAKTWFDTVAFIKPTVTAVSVSVIGESNATLTGVVNPNGFNTTCYFEYGINESYETGSVNKNTLTPAIDVGSEIGNVTVNAEITGLTPETTYYFRLVATNNSGTTFGDDQTFTTLAEPEEEEEEQEEEEEEEEEGETYLR